MQKINDLIAKGEFTEALKLCFENLKALNFNLESFEISNFKLNEKIEILEILRLISLIYYSQKNLMASTEILLKSAEICKIEYAKNSEICEIYADISNDLGLNFKALKDFASALKFLKISAFLKQNLSQKSVKFLGEYVAGLSEVAEILILQRDFLNAKTEYEKIIEICEQNFSQDPQNWAEFYAENLLNFSITLFNLKDQNFMKFLNQSLEISENFKISNAKALKFVEFLKGQK